MNDLPAAKAIPTATRERILAAAHELHYRPNYLARSLRNKRSMSIGVLVLEISEGYFTLVMNGVEEHLLAAEHSVRWLHITGSRHCWKNIPRMLLERSVDGLLLVNRRPLPGWRFRLSPFQDIKRSQE